MMQGLREWPGPDDRLRGGPHPPLTEVRTSREPDLQSSAHLVTPDGARSAPAVRICRDEPQEAENNEYQSPGSLFGCLGGAGSDQPVAGGGAGAAGGGAGAKLASLAAPGGHL